MSTEKGVTAPINGQTTSTSFVPRWRQDKQTTQPLNELLPNQGTEPLVSKPTTVHPAEAQPVNTPKQEAGGPEQNDEREKETEGDSTVDAEDFWNNPEEWLVPGDGYGISITNAAERAYNKLMQAKRFFIRDGDVVQVTAISGATKIELMGPQEFRGILENFFKIKRIVKGPEEGTIKKIHAICSSEIGTAILENDSRNLLPKIERIVNCPVIDRKGKICRKGYHSHLNGGTYITGGAVDDVSLDTATKALTELLSEYHFSSPADRLRALAMLLTPAITQGGLINGPIPVDAAEADDSQTGKTYRQKVSAAIYNVMLSVISKQNGGVGSVDESIASALLAGHSFIQLDNLRGKLDSTTMEAAITSDRASVRVPYHGMTDVSTKGVCFFLSSNGVELTRDLANRCCIIRIRKQPGKMWKEYKEGDLLDHVRANQGFYLGCVFAILKAWINKGCPAEPDTRHSFSKWAAALNCIINKVFKPDDGVKMLDGHNEIQQRTTSPFAALLRAVAIELRDTDRLGDLLLASEIVEVADDLGMPVSGKDDSTKRQTFGRQIKNLYDKSQTKDAIRIDEFTIHREERTNANREITKYYRFETCSEGK